MVKISAAPSQNGKRQVVFILNTSPDKNVYLAGSFNDWEPDDSPMPYDADLAGYTLTLELFPGYYEYKFVINGVWILDESNPNFAANDFGTLNSVVTIN